MSRTWLRWTTSILKVSKAQKTLTIILKKVTLRCSMKNFFELWWSNGLNHFCIIFQNSLVMVIQHWQTLLKFVPANLWPIFWMQSCKDVVLKFLVPSACKTEGWISCRFLLGNVWFKWEFYSRVFLEKKNGNNKTVSSSKHY